MRLEDKKDLLRDGNMASPWQQDIGLKRLKSKHQISETFDAVIIGGGVTGITTALLLQLEGKKCIVLEAHTLGFGTTGGTSAHLNSFFDTTYADIEKDFGKEAAKLVADSGKEALELIRNLIGHFGIECEYETKKALLFSDDDAESKQLYEILESSRNAGLDVEETTSNCLPVPYQKVIKFYDQGQFHPIKYLTGLANVFIEMGGVIQEHQLVTNTGFVDGLHYAETEQGKIKGHHIVYATHIPPGITSFNFRCAPYRSYVIATTLSDEDDYPAELIYDLKEPYHYFRTHIIDERKYLLIGGEDHKTGHGDPEKALNNLITYARQYFDIDQIAFNWSSQYYVPADGLPYIGQFPGEAKGVYVATGFNGNGMTFGTLSAKIISDSILGNENPYIDLYKPSRIKPIAGFSEMIKENADVVWHFVADRFFNESLSSLKESNTDSGYIIEYGGHHLAIYKDKSSKLHLLNASCTHAGCIVSWNPIEKSWDCPCHGARYNTKGEVITGPSQKGLQQLNIDNEE